MSESCCYSEHPRRQHIDGDVACRRHLNTQRKSDDTNKELLIVCRVHRYKKKFYWRGNWNSRDRFKSFRLPGNMDWHDFLMRSPLCWQISRWVTVINASFQVELHYITFIRLWRHLICRNETVNVTNFAVIRQRDSLYCRNCCILSLSASLKFWTLKLI
jgi:hypothetical protein